MFFQTSLPTFSALSFYLNQDSSHYAPIPFFPPSSLVPQVSNVMPLKRTYASLDITEPDTDLNQHQFLPLTRHHQYYLPGGDLYLQTENILFRVHSYFFTRESTEFSALIQDNTNQP